MTDLDPNEEMNSKTVIKVVGVGGGGGNAVNRMIDEGIAGVEFVAVNTDMKDLNKSDADVRIALTDSSSRGLGAGADPERGAKAAQDHQSEIEQVLIRDCRGRRRHRYRRQPDRSAGCTPAGCRNYWCGNETFQF